MKGFIERLNLGTSSRLLKTIPIWPKEWSVSFKIKPNQDKHYQWSSVLHFTTENSRSPVGSRIPAVWFRPFSHRLYIVSHVNDKENKYTSRVLPTNRFTKVEISQRKRSNGKYIYQIKINGHRVRSTVNRIPRELKNVQIYAPDHWSRSSLAQLQNFKYVGYSDGDLLPTNPPAKNIIQSKSTFH